MPTLDPPLNGHSRAKSSINVYGRRVEIRHPEKRKQVGFGFPDDRKTYWFYPVIVVLIAIVMVSLAHNPDSDTKVQAITVLGLAGASLLICFYWAFSLQRAPVSVADYVKGTTASRMMLWFWTVFVGVSATAPLIGIGGQSFVPLWQSALGTFAGMGSVLLTAGPAYKEYREAMATTADTDNSRPSLRQQPDHPPKTDLTVRRHGPGAAPLLAITLVAIAVLARQGRRHGKGRAAPWH